MDVHTRCISITECLSSGYHLAEHNGADVTIKLKLVGKDTRFSVSRAGVFPTAHDNNRENVPCRFIHSYVHTSYLSSLCR
jgi:hypothetical protein